MRETKSNEDDYTLHHKLWTERY